MSGKYTSAQKEATKRHLRKLASLSLRIKEEKYNEIKAFAERKGMSLRGFVLWAIERAMEEEQ